jgi:hypothetical protein
MTTDALCCSLCLLLDGIWSEPIKDWPGFPICREHIAESIARTSGGPVIAPTVDFSSRSPSLH